eukprot:274502-Pleurochrysis_carterae.AAC.7
MKSTGAQMVDEPPPYAPPLAHLACLTLGVANAAARSSAPSVETPSSTAAVVAIVRCAQGVRVATRHRSARATYRFVRMKLPLATCEQCVQWRVSIYN